MDTLNLRVDNPTVMIQSGVHTSCLDKARDQGHITTQSHVTTRGHITALSIRQPWAALIASGQKTVETRSWHTSHRGLLLVVSALRHDPSVCRTTLQKWRKTPDDLRTPGCAIAIVTLLDCRPMRPADAPYAVVKYQPHLWAWILENPRPIRPFPVTGRLRLFSVGISPDT